MAAWRAASLPFRRVRKSLRCSGLLQGSARGHTRIARVDLIPLVRIILEHRSAVACALQHDSCREEDRGQLATEDTVIRL